MKYEKQVIVVPIYSKVTVDYNVCSQLKHKFTYKKFPKQAIEVANYTPEQQKAQVS